jgi:hypothetical protein
MNASEHIAPVPLLIFWIFKGTNDEAQDVPEEQFLDTMVKFVTQLKIKHSSTVKHIVLLVCTFLQSS